MQKLGAKHGAKLDKDGNKMKTLPPSLLRRPPQLRPINGK
jgi:hypothetical protein